MSRTILRNAQIVNDGHRYYADLSIRDEIIESIAVKLTSLAHEKLI